MLHKVHKELFRTTSARDLETLLEYAGISPTMAGNDPSQYDANQHVPPSYSGLRQALGQLTPYQHTVVAGLHGLEGKKKEDKQQIAEKQKKTKRQIESQYYQSLRKLARLLGKNKGIIQQALEEMAKQKNKPEQ